MSVKNYREARTGHLFTENRGIRKKSRIKESFEDQIYPEEIIDEDELVERREILRNTYSSEVEDLAEILGGNDECKKLIDSILSDWTEYDLPMHVVLHVMKKRLDLTPDEVEKVRDYFSDQEERSYRLAESVKNAQKKRALREAREERGSRFRESSDQRIVRGIRESGPANRARKLREGYLMSATARNNPHKKGISQEEQDRIDFAKKMFSKMRESSRSRLEKK